jgi:hypothetical protein
LKIAMKCRGRPAGKPLVWLPILALMITGCSTIYPRLDDPGVVSLNPLPSPAVPSDLGTVAGLEGTWIATNRHPRSSSNPSANQPLAPRAFSDSSIANSPATHLPQSEVEVVTTLILVKSNCEPLVDSQYVLTIDTRINNHESQRTTYLAHPVPIENAVLLSLAPYTLDHLHVLEQLLQQHYMPMNWFLQIQQGDAFLEVGRMYAPWWKQRFAKKPQLALHPKGWNTTLLVADPDRLLRMLKKHAAEADAFTTTTFHRANSDQWPIELLRPIVENLLDAAPLDAISGPILVSEIINHTPYPIDTLYLDRLIQLRMTMTHFKTLLNDYHHWLPGFARADVDRMADGFLTGMVVAPESSADQHLPAPCLLRLTLKDKEDRVLWQAEESLLSHEMAVP